MYTQNSIVAVYPFTRQQEGEEVVIGNVAAGVFLALPAEAVELLDLLATGKSVGEVCAIYHEATGETPDLEDLLTLLETKGLVEPYGRDTSTTKSQALPKEPKYHFSHFPQSVARAIFGAKALTLSSLLLCLTVAAIIRDHSLLPVPKDLVFSEHRAFSLTLLIVVSYLTVFLHEFGHLVATRAVGVNSRMGISHRLWYLVAETDLTGLWSVPRKQRYWPMLAGIQVDLVSTCLLVLLLSARNRNMISLTPLLISLIRATAFTNLMRISWEFFLFTRTDLYFVAATFFNCKNLLNDTNVFLRNQMARIFSKIRTVDQSMIPSSELRAIRIYLWFFVSGRIWAFVILFSITIPITISYGGDLISSLRTGYSANPSDFLDAFATAAYFLVPTLAGFIVWGRSFVVRKGA